MSSYITITGVNGYSVSGSADLKACLKEFHGKGARITAVAVGPSGRYVVCTSTGSAWSAVPGMASKLREVQANDIKQIAFGPNDAWAIVMTDGFCHCSLPPGPLAAVNEHQRSIKYVAMTANQGEWVVGYGNNGWSSDGMNEEVLECMRGVKMSGRIDRVQMGRDTGSWVVEAETGRGRCSFGNDDFISTYDGSRICDIW